MFDLIVQFLTQLGGGPGAAENNLVRFGLPAIFWAVLFVVAWSRQRRESLPRERLLLFGFGLAFARELFMFLHTAERIIVGPVSATHSMYIEPFEHALAVSAVLVISAAFVRYILDDRKLPTRYLVLGLTAVAFGIMISFLIWPGQRAVNPDMHFHDTAGAWFMHITKAVFVSAAIFILIKNKGWVRNVVIIALSFLLASVLLTIANVLTNRAYDFILCPISNNLHIWAVPIFGFVYFREQSIAKKQAEEALAAYRGHLEQLVEQRTAELSTSNEQLQEEINERKRAEDAAGQWAEGLSRLHDISLLLNTSLEPDEVRQLIMTQALALLDCSASVLFRLDEDGQLVLGVASHGMVVGDMDGMRLPVAESESLQKLVSGELIVIEDVWADPRIPPSFWKRFPLRSLIGTAVRGTDGLHGILFLVESTRPRCWQAAEIRLLLNFTSRAGAALENAYLHKQVQWAAALEERQRIAADMHDGLAQTISTLALRNDQVAQMVEDGRLQPALYELTEIQDIITLAGGDLRRSIASLQQDPQPRYSLQEALCELKAFEPNGEEPDICFQNEVIKPLHLPHEQLDQIVSIVQEAIQNARRHARASQIGVHLTQSDGRFEISVEDDGCGFVVESVAELAGNHFGLSIMKARTQRIGGELAIESIPGSGTRLLLRWVGAYEKQIGHHVHTWFETSKTLNAESIGNREELLWQN